MGQKKVEKLFVKICLVKYNAMTYFNEEAVYERLFILQNH